MSESLVRGTTSDTMLTTTLHSDQARQKAGHDSHQAFYWLLPLALLIPAACSEPAPAKPAPAPAPVEIAAVEPAPVETAPVEPAPVPVAPTAHYTPLWFMNATVETLKTQMTKIPKCAMTHHVGGSTSRWPEKSSSCHIQGISVNRQDGDDQLVATSCQGDNVGLIQQYTGPLSNYGPDGSAASSVIKATNGNKKDNAPLEGNLDHVAIGQGIQYSGGYLYPAVASSDCDVHANVTLHDATTGAAICGFTHSSTTGTTCGSGKKPDQHLGAAALTAIDGKLHLLTCSWDCADFFVYSLDPTQDDCGAVQLSGQAMQQDEIRFDKGAGDHQWPPAGSANGYNALAAFFVPTSPTDGTLNLIMLGSHDGYLDTWVIENPTSNKPTFGKLALADWGTNQGGHGSKGMFEEAMTVGYAVTTTDGRTNMEMRIWTAPHDYGVDDGRMNTFAIYECPMEPTNTVNTN